MASSMIRLFSTGASICAEKPPLPLLGVSLRVSARPLILMGLLHGILPWEKSKEPLNARVPDITDACLGARPSMQRTL
jgi:hypothetical protein